VSGTAQSAPTALIAGASGTLGSAIAAELIARGYAVGLHYHTQREKCETLALGVPSARCYAADFSDPAAPAALLSAFVKDFQRIDVLIWAAGIVRDAPVMTLKMDDAHAVLDVNLKAFFLLLKAGARQFIKQKSGCVVALSSHAALAGRSGGAAYAMAHSGMLALVKSAAREWGGMGVRVNAVLPPFVPESGMGRSASAQFNEGVKARRALKSETDGAVATALLVSSIIQNPAISGQVLSADSRIV